MPRGEDDTTSLRHGNLDTDQDMVEVDSLEERPELIVDLDDTLFKVDSSGHMSLDDNLVLGLGADFDLVHVAWSRRGVVENPQNVAGYQLRREVVLTCCASTSLWQTWQSVVRSVRTVDLRQDEGSQAEHRRWGDVRLAGQRHQIAQVGTTNQEYGQQGSKRRYHLPGPLARSLPAAIGHTA